ANRLFCDESFKTAFLPDLTYFRPSTKAQNTRPERSARNFRATRPQVQCTVNPRIERPFGQASFRFPRARSGTWQSRAGFAPEDRAKPKIPAVHYHPRASRTVQPRASNSCDYDPPPAMLNLESEG